MASAPGEAIKLPNDDAFEMALSGTGHERIKPRTFLLGPGHTMVHVLLNDSRAAICQSTNACQTEPPEWFPDTLAGCRNESKRRNVGERLPQQRRLTQRESHPKSAKPQ